VAESVGIASLPDEVAAALAGDVEFRLWELIEVSVVPSPQPRLGCHGTRAPASEPENGAYHVHLGLIADSSRPYHRNRSSLRGTLGARA